MSELWPLLGVGALAFVCGGWYFRPRRPPEPVVFTDAREERLARQLGRLVGCAAEQALPAVRREIEYSPHLADEALVKRAAYHYRQDQPEPSCPAYRDRARG